MRRRQKLDFDAAMAVFAHRCWHLLRTIIRMPFLYAFLTIFVLSWLYGFKAYPFLSVRFVVWVRVIFNLAYLAWAIVFIGFVQRIENYEVDSFTLRTQHIPVKGNKVFSVYLLAIGVLLFTVALEWITTGYVTYWAFAICAFLQILPLMAGETLEEQAEPLSTLIAGWILLLDAMFLIAVSVH